MEGYISNAYISLARAEERARRLREIGFDAEAREATNEEVRSWVPDDQPPQVPNARAAYVVEVLGKLV